MHTQGCVHTHTAHTQAADALLPSDFCQPHMLWAGGRAYWALDSQAELWEHRHSDQTPWSFLQKESSGPDSVDKFSHPAAARWSACKLMIAPGNSWKEQGVKPAFFFGPLSPKFGYSTSTSRALLDILAEGGHQCLTAKPHNHLFSLLSSQAFNLPAAETMWQLLFFLGPWLDCISQLRCGCVVAPLRLMCSVLLSGLVLCLSGFAPPFSSPSSFCHSVWYGTHSQGDPERKGLKMSSCINLSWIIPGAEHPPTHTHIHSELDFYT